jgi:hypothetical protein
VAALLMVFSPWLLPLLFMPCVACTYMPNASWRRRGGKAQGRGISHSWSGSEAGEERAERSGGLHKRSAEDCGKPLRRARAAPSAKFGFLMRAHQAHRNCQGGVAGGNGPLWWEAKNAQQSQRGRRPPPTESWL